MERKMVCLLGIFLLVVMVSGCIGEDTTQPPGDTQPQCHSPKKMIGDVCCFDENDNGVCDMDEAGCPASCDDGDPCTNDTCSVSTDFKCVHETLYPCCGNGVCETDENVNNICPEDCEIIDMTDFQYLGVSAYPGEENVFVFLHTTHTESEEKVFFLNITAGDEDIDKIGYTFKCNSSKHKSLDSIDAEENVTEDTEIKIHILEDEHYIIYSNFFVAKLAAYDVDIDKLDAGKEAQYLFRIEKKDVQKRDELSCLFKFYFMQPHKLVYKWLKISYI